jgi:hypothetical protein
MKMVKAMHWREGNGTGRDGDEGEQKQQKRRNREMNWRGDRMREGETRTRC